MYLKEIPDKSRIVYALVDDQSSHSLATTPFFDFFSPGSMEHQYVLSSCAGRFTASGRKSRSYVIESLDSTCKLDLPSIIECNDIPKNRDENPIYRHRTPVFSSSRVPFELCSIHQPDMVECH